MPFFRLLIALNIITILVTIGAYLITKQGRFLRWAQLAFKLLLIVGLTLFVILILERAL